MIHAILAIQQRLFRENLSARLSHYGDVRIEAHAESEVDIAVALRKLLGDRRQSEKRRKVPKGPVIVVVSIDDTLDTPEACTRLLSEFPHITIFGIRTDSMPGRSFQLRINMQEFECSLGGLADAIRERTRTIPPW